MKYRSTKMSSRIVGSTEQIKTPEQIRNDMIAEIVASQSENTIPPDQLNNLLLGPQATGVNPVQ